MGKKDNIFSTAEYQKDKGVIYCWANNKCYMCNSTNFSTRLYNYYNI